MVLKEGSKRSRGREAQHGNITAAKVVAESVRSALGPKGMDKMLVDSFGDITMTSDGRTVLDEMDIQHPAAKMLVEVATHRPPQVVHSSAEKPLDPRARLRSEWPGPQAGHTRSVGSAAISSGAIGVPQ